MSLVWIAAALAAPVAHELLLPVPPERVWAVLGGLDRWPDWWAEPGGPETRWDVAEGADGATLRWTAGAAGAGALRLTSVSPPDRVGYELRLAHAPASAAVRGMPPAHRGTVQVVPEGEGARVRWEAEVLPSVVLPGAAQRLDHAIELRLARLAVVAGADPRPTTEAVVRSDGLFVWQGYSQRWSYNHRVNRHGDWVEPPTCGPAGCDGAQVHAAASGSGADRARTRQYTSFVAAPGVVAWSGGATLLFDGDEAERLEDHACVVAPAPGGPVVLQGWDVDAVGPADSLWALELGVEERDGQVCVDGRLRMACTTPECGTERRTAYGVHVRWAQLAGPVRATLSSVGQDARWEADDLRDEVVPASVSLALAGTPGGVATVGLRRFAIELDQPHHTLGVDVVVEPGTWNAAEGVLPARVDLAYVPWGPVEIAPLTVAQFARPGRATLELGLVLLQLPSGCVAAYPGAVEGWWPGGNEDGSGPGAEVRRELHAGPCPAR